MVKQTSTAYVRDDVIFHYAKVNMNHSIQSIYCRGDAEARIGSSTTVFLQRSRFIAILVASCKFTPTSSQSCFMPSIHLFFGLPLLLCPCTYPCSRIFLIPFIFHSADVSEVSQPTLSDSLVDIFVVVQPCINLYIPYPVHTCNAFYLS